MNSQLSRRTTETHKLYKTKEIEDLPPAEVNNASANTLQLTELYSAYGRKGCMAPNCVEPHCSRGFCAKHYYRLKRNGSLERGKPGRPANPNPPTLCRIQGCPNKRSNTFTLCGFHRWRIKRYGDCNAAGVFADSVGGSAQETVAIALRSFGRTVEVAPYISPYDLLVDGKYRIEVKGGDKRAIKVGKYRYDGWSFNIHRHGILSEENVDFYILSFAHQLALLKAPLNVKTLAFRDRSLTKGKYQKHLAAFLAFARGEFGKVEVAA